jgi:hypothetical protein
MVEARERFERRLLHVLGLAKLEELRERTLDASEFREAKRAHGGDALGHGLLFIA